MEKINDYLTDGKFKLVAGMLLDTKLEVAGEYYIIFSANNEAIVNKVYSNYALFLELLTSILGANYTFVVITNDEWSKYRDKYIEDIKAGNKYEIKEIEKKRVVPKKVNKKETVVDKLFELVGEENVEFK